MNREEIVAILQAHGSETAAFGIKSLKLFGSAARGEAGPHSDADFLVEFDGPVTYDRYCQLKFYLEDLLGVRVDLVTVKALKPRMKPIVERDAIRVA